jgi:PAS domain S-box-containing protein
MRLTLTIVYLAAAATSVAAALVLLRRRQMSAGVWLALTILAAGFWALCDAFELQAVTASGKRLISQAQYLGVVTAAPFYFHAATALARLESGAPRLRLAAVWLVPALTLVAAWTSRWHDWLWRDVSIPDPATNLGVYEYGSWFWLFTAHAYLLLAVASVALVVATRRVSAPFRVPIAAVGVAVLLPWIGNVTYVFKLLPLPGLNPLSISILLSACILAWATTRRGLLDLLPQARETLVAGMQDGVLLANVEGRIVYANAAARRLLGSAGPLETLPAGLHLPRPVNDGAAGFEHAAHGAAEVEHAARADVEIVAPGAHRWLDVQVDPVHDRWNEVAGSIYVLRDITARKGLESEREKLIVELEAALRRVRTLEGILPICASCRRIREEDGSWSRLDAYVRRHTGVDFSHGVCPECERRLYGEYID